MERTDSRYQAYMNILKEELIPAMGCTEPIALAYGAAVARQELGALPDRVVVGVSGSILKRQIRDCPQHRPYEGDRGGGGSRNCGWRRKEGAGSDFPGI